MKRLLTARKLLKINKNLNQYDKDNFRYLTFSIQFDLVYFHPLQTGSELDYQLERKNIFMTNTSITLGCTFEEPKIIWNSFKVQNEFKTKQSQNIFKDIKLEVPI
ncbi:Hypothetical_protein [Hexamita inflata]|uniref:Hypothetical_protein n=1 Tax=Hexamita inflata TaxID=28002 RepID=A0ABP1GKH7_9EUKA